MSGVPQTGMCVLVSRPADARATFLIFIRNRFPDSAGNRRTCQGTCSDSQRRQRWWGRAPAIAGVCQGVCARARVSARGGGFSRQAACSQASPAPPRAPCAAVQRVTPVRRTGSTASRLQSVPRGRPRAAASQAQSCQSPAVGGATGRHGASNVSSQRESARARRGGAHSRPWCHTHILGWVWRGW
jgi:hypothetical protein